MKKLTMILLALAAVTLVVIVWAYCPEPPLSIFFRAHGIDPETMDRGRVRLRVIKSSRSFQVLYGDTVVRSWRCSTGPGIPPGGLNNAMKTVSELYTLQRTEKCKALTPHPTPHPNW